MSSPAEDSPADRGRPRTWWSVAVGWRNWPLLVKLGVVVVVPVVGALVLGVLRVQADVALSESYAGIERVATVRVQLVRVLAALQQERIDAVGHTTGMPKAVRTTDLAVAEMTDLVRQTPDGDEQLADTAAYRELNRLLDTLPSTREQQPTNPEGLVVLGTYSAVINAALEFDRSLVGRFPDENLTNTSIALGELQAVREQVALQQAVGLLALRDNGVADSARQLMIEADVRLDDQLGDFRSVATPALRARYDATVRGQDVDGRQRLVDAARTIGPAQAGFTAEQWNAVSSTTTGLMSRVTEWAAADLRAGSDELTESVSDRAGLESVLLLAMVLLAGGVGGGLGRYLLRSVGLLRRAALDVAHNRLPAAVASLRSGRRRRSRSTRCR